MVNFQFLINYDYLLFTTLKESVVRLLKEFVILEKIKDEFFLAPSTKEEAEPFVMKHYLEAFPSDSKRIYGIYRKTPQGNSQVGVVIYGLPYFTAAKFLRARNIITRDN